MFNFFKKNRKEVPEFTFLKNHPLRNSYFSRIKKWKWLNEQEIILFSKDENGKIKTITPDFWFQEMFLDSDGTITVYEYLPSLIKRYQDSNMEVPNDLDEFIIETLTSLKNDLNAIEFNNSPIKINPEFKNPIE